MGSFGDYLDKLKNTAEYYAAAAKDNFVNELLRVMGEKNINQKELAQKVGVSNAYVSRVLGGDMNLSIESMSKFAFALGARIEISAKPIAAEKNAVSIKSIYGMPGSRIIKVGYGPMHGIHEGKVSKENITQSGEYTDGSSIQSLAA